MRLRRWLMAGLLTLGLAGCGGGGGGGSENNITPAAQDGALSLGLAGGATAGAAHVWVTVQTIALNDEITAVQLHDRRMATTVLLIQTLDGG